MRIARWPAWAVLCISLMFGPVVAAEEPPVDEPAAKEQSLDEQLLDETSSDDAPMDARALGILDLMAETLAQAQGFSVTIQAGYDVIQDTGQKIEFGERRKVALSRPDRLRVEVEESDGTQALVFFDGKAITVFSPGENVYGQIEKAGTVDDAVRYVIQDLGMRLPLALLLVTTLPDEFEQRLESIDYVERNTLTRVPTDHLAGRSADVDFELWVAAGDTPLPQRVSITYKNEEGAPQYRAEFSDWKLDPDLSKVDLAFRPPEGAEAIPFVVRVRRSGTDQPSMTGEAPADGMPAASGSMEGLPK
ncbi:DUF2092 domain-containing protein [Skermanella mucosa]|uniref:DUF2092 domain-containing protein n=1 Tax=Skermanella mucosa TaxID=1789672 RepID=UPI00192C687F|nr:DUF2092 domain-containing protein [Skermanella mucosa]UEM19763.1 DUF2092 domain-containing protein [Skermanella mucosa]